MTAASSHGVRPASRRCAVVVPCLNEREHIGELLTMLGASARALDCTVFVADGGSTDGTQAIVAELARTDPRIRLVDNPGRIQSVAVNTVVDMLPSDVEYFIRVDVHGGYSSAYCETLVEEAARSGAASVVVSMLTTGRGPFQRAVARAQNSLLGTGGSRHRIGSSGRWVDHGHHALMSVSAFREVGGYDESFSHNEDAELDVRLRKAGYRIWMTDRAQMIYYPRSTTRALFRQYLNYGKGRAQNILKHRTMPKFRQMLPLLVAPAAFLACFAPLHWIFAVPLLGWTAVCMVAGIAAGSRKLGSEAVLVGFAAMVMHLAWSSGFWIQLLRQRRRGAAA